MPHRPWSALTIAALLCAATPRATAAPAPTAAAPAAYAVIVGSNHGGAGQTPLAYAEADAGRVAELLRELGGYRAADVRVLARPSPDELLAALDAVSARVAADVAAGRPATLFFYYSGHARASALNLGDGELPLGLLRERLLAVPATFTVVVLDACQSGAFSRVKGAQPAADFSYNSLATLNATGMAVLASSSESELSQESDRLGSSYFTHHLLVGLRGAGDADGDGRVSLDEAYRYAYNRTLVATAATAVGTQHVSLEVDLKGQGEVALTFPERAGSRLELPASLEAEVLVERRKAQAVVAELHKSAGAAVLLALPSGDYRVLVRVGGRLRQCPIVLRDGSVVAIDLAGCQDAPQEETTSKGGGAAAAPWGIELGVGAGTSVSDAYTDRLLDFGYHRELFDPNDQLLLAGSYRVHGGVYVGGELDYLGGTTYRRDTDLEPLRIHWATTIAGATVRWIRPLGQAERWVPFAQLGAGMALGSTRFVDETGQVDNDRFIGWHLQAAAGLYWMPWRRVGFFGRATWVTAPVFENLLGDRHDGGGFFGAVGVRWVP